MRVFVVHRGSLYGTNHGTSWGFMIPQALQHSPPAHTLFISSQHLNPSSRAPALTSDISLPRSGSQRLSPQLSASDSLSHSPDCFEFSAPSALSPPLSQLFSIGSDSLLTGLVPTGLVPTHRSHGSSSHT
eukprot:1636926-Rhodomonas_salina.1